MFPIQWGAGFLVAVIVLRIFFVWIFPLLPIYKYEIFGGVPDQHMFAVQAVDTMKYSRDMSGQILDNPESYVPLIDNQMALIERVGATHVAIGTPYDEHFLPVLKLWVDSARRHHLAVWFRGNFSGWEGWFEYDRIGRDTHKRLLEEFILKNPDLFVTGDIFSPCPECENGGPGDPRSTRDAEGYRSFLIAERAISLKGFNTLGKSLTVYMSMNGDIARDIITPKTQKELGGTVLIDHYVDTPEHFGKDITSISRAQNGKIGIGEFGAPIPDLQGKMTQEQQAHFIRKLLYEMYLQRETIPVVNYWTLQGGSTAIVSDLGEPRTAYFALQSYFRAPSVHGLIYNSLGEPLGGASVSVASTTLSIASGGYSYQVFLPGDLRTLTVRREGYLSQAVVFPESMSTSSVKDFYLRPVKPTWWYRIRVLVYGEIVH